MCCFLSIDRRTNGVGTSGGTLKDRIIDGGHKWAAFVQNVNAMNLQVMIALTAVNVAPIVLWFWKAINQAAQVVKIPLWTQNWICTLVVHNECRLLWWKNIQYLITSFLHLSCFFALNHIFEHTWTDVQCTHHITPLESMHQVTWHGKDIVHHCLNTLSEQTGAISPGLKQFRFAASLKVGVSGKNFPTMDSDFLHFFTFSSVISYTKPHCGWWMFLLKIGPQRVRSH